MSSGIVSAPSRLTSVVTRISGGRDRSRLVLTFGVILYVVRVIAPGWRTGFPQFFPDSASYLDVSRLGPFDPSFWWAQRAVGVPLVIWLTGGNDRLFFLVQTLLYAVAVAFLCSVILSIVRRRWLAWITVGMIASICAHPRFGLWHLEILSESLSLSLSVFMIAAWLRVMHSPTRRHLFIGIAVTVAWMSLRDVHIVFGFILAIALFAWGAASRHWSLRSGSMLGAGVLVVFGSYVLVAQSVSDRNVAPLINNVGERVLPDPEVTETFVSLGMPLDDVLRERTGSDAWSDDQAFLRDPDLAEFRSWADARGQRALLTSLIVDAPFWLNTTERVLDSTLPLDFTEYDRHATSLRLPTRLFWFQGPRTSMQLAGWAAGAAGALVALVVAAVRPSSASEQDTLRSGRRRAPAMAGVALVAVLADLHVSASGDSVEVQRHVLGSVFRLSLVLVILVALGVASILDRLRPVRETAPTSPHHRQPATVSGAVAASLGAIGVFGAWIALEHRSQDFDPLYVRTIIERAARYGGSYYENGIHNKGPLETLVYDSARLFTSFDTYWFGIGTYVLLASLLLGWTAWRIAQSIGVTRRIAGLAAVLVSSHFALSASDYAGVLYSRNITTTILAVVVAITVWDAPWRHPIRTRIVYLALFALLGLAVQTLLTTVFTAVVVGAFVFVRRSSAANLQHPGSWAVATGFASLATAPMWYALRGTFTEFWANWWTYAGFMSAGTGRSLLDQFGLGAQKMFGYYQQRPGIALLLAAFVYFLRRNWPVMSTATRTLHTMLLAWLGAGWVELVLSQRYSSHYFSVIAVPTALIAVATGAAVIDVLVTRHPRTNSSSGTDKRPSLWASIACVVTLVAVQGTHLVWTAIEGAGSFRSTGHYVEARADLRTGGHLTRRAVINLASSSNDPLLAWTMYPWTYLDYRRVPATRLSWKSFMIGEIYLGRTSSRYVLDQTWDWFADDLAETQPRVYARPQVTKLLPGNPFAEYVTANFTPVYADEDLDIQWRTDVWDSVTGDLSGDRPLVPNADIPGSWRYDAETRRLTADSGADEWLLPMAPCQRLSMRLLRESTADPMGVSVTFASDDPDDDPVSLHVDFDQSWSSRRGDDIGAGVSTQLASTSLSTPHRTELDVLLVVGPTSAALIVDGRIVSAVVLERPSTIELSSTIDQLVIENLAIGDVAGLAGC